MSLASDYAAAQASAANAQVAANQAAPPPFVGPNGSLMVTTDGKLMVTPVAGTSGLTLPPQAALAAAQWIIDTFGG